MLADSKNASMTDREVFQRGFPTDSASQRRSFGLEGDSTKWLGRTTAREISVMLEGILNGKYANPEHSKQMMDILGRQFYSSRLPQRLQFRAQVAHKTGDWPPFAGNDVGVIFYKGGPLVVSVFTNRNQGDFFQLEATIGRIAERLVNEWKCQRRPFHTRLTSSARRDSAF